MPREITPEQLLFVYSRYRLVAELIRSGVSSFNALCRKVEMNANVMASHLGRLESAGFIKTTRTAIPGKRPSTLIQVTERGRQMFYEHRRVVAAAGEPVVVEVAA
jgi:DNA-binding HxlR family transcriptional regulator